MPKKKTKIEYELLLLTDFDNLVRQVNSIYYLSKYKRKNINDNLLALIYSLERVKSNFYEYSKKFSENLDKQRIKVCLSFLDLKTQIEFRDYLSKVIEKRIERNLKNVGISEIK